MIRSCIALAVCLLMVPPAAAAEGGDSAVIVTARPLALSGHARVEAREAAIEWSERSAPLEWHVEDAEVEIRRVSMPVLETPLGDVSYQPEFTTERRHVRAGTIAIHPLMGAAIRLHGQALFTLEGADAEGLLVEYAAATPAFHYRAPSTSRPFYHSAPGLADAFMVQTKNATGSFDGPAEAFVVGAHVRLSDAAGTTDVVLGERSIRDPLAPNMRRDEYAFLLVGASSLRFDAQPLEAVQVTSASVAVDGSVRFDALEGSARADRSHFPNLVGDNAVTGKVEVRHAEQAEGAARYTLGGEFEGVTLAGHDVEVKALDGSTVLGLAAVVAVLVAAARGSLASFAGTLYTRIARSSVLDHPARARALEHLQLHPGTHLRDLQRALGCGWGTLHYHLAVLCKADLVVVERAGKHALAYARLNTTNTQEQKLLLRGQAIHVFVALESGALTQRELATRLGLSRQLVAHHLSLLEREGLVRASAGRPKRYGRQDPTSESTRSGPSGAALARN